MKLSRTSIRAALSAADSSLRACGSSSVTRLRSGSCCACCSRLVGLLSALDSEIASMNFNGSSSHGHYHCFVRNCFFRQSPAQLSYLRFGRSSVASEGLPAAVTSGFCPGSCCSAMGSVTLNLRARRGRVCPYLLR